MSQTNLSKKNDEILKDWASSSLFSKSCKEAIAKLARVGELFYYRGIGAEMAYELLYEVAATLIIYDKADSEHFEEIERELNKRRNLHKVNGAQAVDSRKMRDVLKEIEILMDGIKDVYKRDI